MTNPICDGAVGYAPVLSCINDLTGGAFGLTIVVLTWSVIYLRTRTNGSPRDAAAAASFVTFLAALLLRVLGALGDKTLGATLALLIGSAAILAFTRRA